MKKIVLLFIIISFISCEDKNAQRLLPGSNGRQNELMVVIDYKDWEGKIGRELKKVLHSNVLGLPRAEPQFVTMPIDHKYFTGTLRYNRNILNIMKGDSSSISIKHEVNARPQTYITVKGSSEQEIIKIIKENATKIITTYKDSDIKALQKRFVKNAHKIDTLKLFIKEKIALSVPLDFNIVADEDDFIWFRKRFNHGGHNINGSLNVLAYTLPLEVPFLQIKDSIISIRNATGKKYIPGPSEGSYMITESAYTPHIFDASLTGRKAYKTQGKWDILHDFMAGPFVNYTIEDKKNNRLIIVEGLAYAPSINKRDFMFELEAIIRTLKIE